MMQKLADDPAFWGALSAILGLIVVWAKAKAAEIEGRETKKALEQVTSAVGGQGARLVEQSEKIAALQATISSTPAPAPLAPPLAPLSPAPPQVTPAASVTTTPTVIPMPLQSAAPTAQDAPQDSVGQSPPG